MNTEDKKHSDLAPSASARYLRCTASPKYIKSLGLTSEPSEYAQIGTAVHAVIENCIKFDIKPEYYIGQTVEGVVIDTAMAENAAKAENYIRKRAEELTSTDTMFGVYSEIYVELSFLDIEGLDGGTVDCAIVTGNELEVIDYKNGSVYVDETCNSQLMIYAIGLIHKFELKNGAVNLTIIQPNSKGDAIRTYHTSVDEVLKWRDVVLLPKGKQIMQGGEFKPSEIACKYCPAKAVCVSLKDSLEKQAMIEFEQSKDLPDVASLTAEQKAKIVEVADQITDFIETVKKNVLSEIKKGSKEYDTVLKLVRKNTKRRFTEIASDPIMSPLLDVLDYDEVYKSSMRSLSEIEKSLKKKLSKEDFENIIAECVEKPLGDIEVVPLSDKRQSVDYLLLNKD